MPTGNVELRHNGRAVNGAWRAALLEADVTQELNLPTQFRARFSMVDFADSGLRGVDLDKFQPGDTLQVAMGIGRPETLVEGELTALEPDFGGYSTLEIRGYDRLYRLNFGTHRRLFRDKTDSDIARDLAREGGLSPRVSSSPLTHDLVIQENVSNFSFLRERAELVNFEIAVDGARTFHFRPSREGKGKDLELSYPADLSDLNLRLRVLTKGEKVEALAWDMAKKQVTKGRATKPTAASKMGGKAGGQSFGKRFPDGDVAIIDVPLRDKKAAGDVAKAQYQAALQSFIEGEGTLVGTPKLRVGINLLLRGLGRRFSGLYYVTRCVHRFSHDHGYKTRFQVRRTGI